MIQIREDSPLLDPIGALSPDPAAAYALDARMMAALPQLKEAVKQGWKNYRTDLQHVRVDAMREEIKLLVYWLAREVARSSSVNYQEGDTRQRMRVGVFGGQTTTDLHHQLYDRVFSKHTVTELVSAADKDMVGFLYTILKNDKISLYRKWRTEVRYVKDIHPANSGGKDEEGDAATLEELFGHFVTPERIAESMQCLEHFFDFLQAEQLNEKLEKVAWVLWLSEPLSTGGEDVEYTHNTDIRLAESLSMPKSTFDRYKGKAKLLVERFRQSL